MKTLKFGLLIISVILLSNCGGEPTLEDKKEELKALKAQVSELQHQIKALTDEISELDPSFIRDNSTLVSTVSPKNKTFVHKIEIRGSVQSRKNIILSAETMGRINKINVKEGAKVKKGQTLLNIDAQTLRNTIEELKTSLELATVVYKKQANLWENNIGSEIQYLEAKNRKESLERRLATAYSQLDMATIESPFSGSVDAVFVKEGEMAQPGAPMFRIVSLDEMYITADIPENYIGKFNVNDKVMVTFPAFNNTFESKITAIGQVINTKNRTFSVEVALNSNRLVKPNLTAILELQDYKNEDAWVIPTEIIQKDNKGDFVFLVENNQDQTIAKKLRIERGKSFENETELLNEITGDELIVDRGFREVADGISVKMVNKQNLN